MQATTLAQNLMRAFAPKRAPHSFMPRQQMKQQATAALNQKAVEFLQFRDNRKAITTGEPLATADRNDIFRHNREMLADLWHGRNLDVALARAEMLVQSFKILLSLYVDEGKLPTTWRIIHDAVDCLNLFNNQKKIADYKTNRHTLRDLELLIDLLDNWLKFVPIGAVDEVSRYNIGFQICYYFNSLMCFRADDVAAAFRVIRGASIESTAVKHGLKASKLREQTLFVGQVLYRLSMVSDEYAHIEPARSIPELRAKGYAQLADLPILKKLADRARALYCVPFESKFGVFYFDWKIYNREISNGYVQIMLKLK